jgi:large subunit ribosomal protein L22
VSGLIDLDEVAGARASHRYARLSATKARAVLDLIRNEDVDRAAEILRLSERAAAEVVGKVLRSAVSNAIHNEGLDADQLYVAECFADEGPTLKRFRPRSRGRAGRIRKRTCHITLVVAQLDAAELAAREAARGRAVERGATAGDRRARVAASRRAAGQAEPAEVAGAAEAEAEFDETAPTGVAEAAGDTEDTVEVGEPTEDMVAEAADTGEAADTDETADSDTTAEAEADEVPEVEAEAAVADDEGEALPPAGGDEEGRA